MVGTSPTIRLDLGGQGPPAQEPIELGQLAPFALPAHPHPLALVQAAGAMEQVRRRPWCLGLVAHIQRPHALDAAATIAASVSSVLGRGVGEVAEQGEMQVRAAVGEVQRLEVLQRFAHRRQIGQQVGTTTAVRSSAGTPAVFDEVELGQRPGRQEGGDQLVDQVDCHVDLPAAAQTARSAPAPRTGRCRPPPGSRAASSAASRTDGDAADEHQVRVAAAPGDGPIRPAAGGSRPPAPARRAPRRPGSSRRGRAGDPLARPRRRRPGPAATACRATSASSRPVRLANRSTTWRYWSPIAEGHPPVDGRRDPRSGRSPASSAARRSCASPGARWRAGW